MSQRYFTKGILEESGRGQCVTIAKTLTGCVLWGPYVRLEPGEWSVRFDIEPEDRADPMAAACIVDVVIDTGRTQLAKAKLTVAELAANGGSTELAFRLENPSTVEFRVFALGQVELKVLYFRKAARIGGGRDALAEIPFYRGNFDRFAALERGGLSFALRGDVIVGKFADVSFEVVNTEDLQVISEVFLANEYTIAPSSECVAFDVGMNVGLASLKFASNERVRRVVAFEPFSAPFQRAKRNIALNPALAAKIEPRNVGLAEADEEKEVLSDANTTIGVSIRGVGRGDKETIAVRDAATALRRDFDAARDDGLGVILKLDCEGSEFAIVGSLERAGLLSRVDVIVIEWHKWWSRELTQADLIGPLNREGFMVFDRTNPLNQAAGVLLGVRAARDIVSR